MIILMDIDKILKRMQDKMPVYNYSSEAEERLGMPGAMLSGSKTAPKGQTVYWNACIFNEAEEQIWHGDLNLTRKAKELQELADAVGPIHVTPESPFRFDGFKRGKSERGDAIRTFTPRQPATQEVGK